jgi:uncharacterized RDD family membrane protein YckC
MGKYSPQKGRRPRTVAETLKEAEHEHFADCPNADTWTRLTAVFLDLVLCAVAANAIQSLASVFLALIQGSIETILNRPWPFSITTSQLTHLVTWSLRSMLFYSCWVWSVFQYGGSPGKLLLGLRTLDVETGEKLGPWRAFFRELVLKPLSILSVAGILQSWARTDRRAWHDTVCSTVVKSIRGRF